MTSALGNLSAMSVAQIPVPVPAMLLACALGSQFGLSIQSYLPKSRMC